MASSSNIIDIMLADIKKAKNVEEMDSALGKFINSSQDNKQEDIEQLHESIETNLNNINNSLIALSHYDIECGFAMRYLSALRLSINNAIDEHIALKNNKSL